MDGGRPPLMKINIPIVIRTIPIVRHNNTMKCNHQFTTLKLNLLEFKARCNKKQTVNYISNLRIFGL